MTHEASDLHVSGGPRKAPHQAEHHYRLDNPDPENVSRKAGGWGETLVNSPDPGGWSGLGWGAPVTRGTGVQVYWAGP